MSDTRLKQAIERIEAASREYLHNLESPVPFDSYTPDVFDVELLIKYVKEHLDYRR